MSGAVQNFWEKCKNYLSDIANIGGNQDDISIEIAKEEPVFPASYMQHFSLGAIKDESNLVGREKEVHFIRQSHENWKVNNQPLLVVSEPGLGMSSIVDIATNEWNNKDIIKNEFNISSRAVLVKYLANALNIPNAESLQQIIETLNDEPRVIIFENVERLFLRRVNGFRILEDFLLFVHQTKKSIFWIITINKYSHYYLNQAIGFSSNFMVELPIRPLEVEDIKSILLARNGNHDLVFLTPANASNMLLRQIKKMTVTERQKSLENNFFRQLKEFSSGSISRAILFWKKSLVTISNEKVYFRAFQQKGISDLSLNDIFILEAIFEHFSLSTHELGLVLRNINFSRNLTMEKLEEKGIIFPITYDGDQPEYRINLLFYQELKQLFHSRLNRNFN